MSLNDFAIILVIGLIITSTPLGLYLEIRSSDKKREKKLKEQDDLFNKMKQEPKYVINFKTDEGERLSKQYGPIKYICYSVMNPEEAAQRALNRFYEQGYFIDAYGTTYPTCNVKSANVRQVYKSTDGD